MPLDLSGFTTPQYDFANGLREVSGLIASHRQQQFQERKYNEQLKKDEELKKKSSTAFVSNLLNKKSYLTGSPDDGVIGTMIDNAYQQAISLAQDGADSTTIAQTMSPVVSRIQEYSQKAKMINAQIQQAAQQAAKVPGYDPMKVKQAMQQEAFFAPDPNTGKMSLKPLDQIDPTVNYFEKVQQDAPENIIDGSAINKTLAKVKPQPYDNVQTELTKYGSIKHGIKASHYAFQDFVRDGDGTLVLDANGQPKMAVKADQIHDGGKPLDGMYAMDQAGYDYLNAIGGQAVQDQLRGQARAAFKQQGLDIPNENDPKFQLMMRHLAYEETKALPYTAQIVKSERLNKMGEKYNELNDPEYQAKLAASRRKMSQASAEGRKAGGKTPEELAADAKARAEGHAEGTPVKPTKTTKKSGLPPIGIFGNKSDNTQKGILD